jgi:hypothetical protein
MRVLPNHSQCCFLRAMQRIQIRSSEKSSKMLCIVKAVEEHGHISKL